MIHQYSMTNHYRLDAVVNNAAVGSRGDTLAEQYAQAFATNVTGTVLVTEAFEPLLSKASDVPRLINVSSGAGSVGKRADPSSSTGKLGFWGLPYSASKAAFNLITLTQASVYGSRSPDSKETDITKPGAQGKPWKVFAYTPGFVVSNLGPHNNAENGAGPTSGGAAPIVSIIHGERDGEHGRFLSRDGQYPW
jgi:NAD(P)-dependent dehydrogenase (short-subunit alcohol dehydrogenase family)